MFSLVADTEFTGVLEVLAEMEGDARAKLRRVAEFIGIWTTDYLKTYIAGWLLEHTLVAGYGWAVHDDLDGITLELFNSSDFAARLEMREGYFILHGVTDPGGAVEKALRLAVEELAPGWEVVHG